MFIIKTNRNKYSKFLQNRRKQESLTHKRKTEGCFLFEKFNIFVLLKRTDFKDI
jgi:hypothetical protein